MRYSELIENLDDDELFGGTAGEQIVTALEKHAQRHYQEASRARELFQPVTASQFEQNAKQYLTMAQQFKKGILVGLKHWLSFDAGDRAMYALVVRQQTGIDLNSMVGMLDEDLDDDELFGKSRNQIIAQGLYTEAAKERDVAAEERGLGDLRNSHDFAKQAAETEALAREFEISLHNGMRAWRSIKNSFRRSDFADIVEYHTELNLYDIDKIVSEELDDDELFGKDNDTRSTLRTLKRLRQSVQQDPQAHGIRDLLKNYNNENSTLEQRAHMTLEYMASTIGMTKEQFEAAAPDLMFAANFEYHRPWQLWDLKTIDKTIHFFQYVLDRETGMIGMNEDSDDDLFGAQPSGAKGMIYQVGKQILNRLEQSWGVPDIQTEYNKYQEVGDSDAQFDQVVRITKKPFKQVFVVDTIIREFAGMEGLNDFGWMLNSGQFHELTDAWERFKNDDDIESEDWFQREAQDFMGKRV